LVFPLICPKCRGPMKIIAFLENPPVIRKILQMSGNLGNASASSSPKDRFLPPGGTDGGGSFALGRRPGFILTTTQTRSTQTKPFPTVLGSFFPL